MSGYEGPTLVASFVRSYETAGEDGTRAGGCVRPDLGLAGPPRVRLQ